MNAPPKLRVVAGGKCPEPMRESALRALDVRLAEISAEVSKLAEAARVELGLEDASDLIKDAAGALNAARVDIAGKVRR